MPGTLPERGGDPVDALVRGHWREVDPVRTFGPETLYEEIDGEAELYLPYSFRELRVAVLAPVDRPASQVRLELFQHGNLRDAYGVYSQYRFPGQETMRIGSSEAIVSDFSLDFFQGETFVRIRSAAPETSRDDLTRLGEELAARLPGTGRFPREADALRIPGSAPGPVVFHRRALLGYEALAPGFEARFDDGKISGRILLFMAEDIGPVSGFLDRLARELPEFAPSEEGYHRAALSAGTLRLLSRERYHVGFVGKATRRQAEAILADLDRRAGHILSGRPQ